jgi:hypothetical protein
MNFVRRVWRWFNGGESHRRVVVTPAVALLVILVSGAWHFDGWTHDIVRRVCSYRGYMLTTWHAYRMIGGALLIPNDDFWGSLPGLIAALYPLERRIGSWWTLGVIACAHVFSSVVAGIGLRLLHDTHTLHVHDVGTSVLMVSAASMLATVTRNRWLWAFVLTIYLIDLVLSHDLASAEHTLAIGCGVVGGLGYRRRSVSN